MVNVNDDWVCAILDALANIHGDVIVTPSLGKTTDISEEFLADLSVLYDEMEKRNHQLDRLKKCTSSIPYDIVISPETWKRTVDVFFVADKEQDFRPKKLFLLLMRKLLLHTDNLNAALSLFYAHEHLQVDTGRIPNYSTCYKEFNEELSEVIDEITREKCPSGPQLDDLSRRLGFLLLIAPKPTLKQVLLSCLNETTLVPNMTKVLRCLPAFNEYRVYAYSKPARYEPLYVTFFRRLFSSSEEEEYFSLHTEDGMRNAEFLLLELSVTRMQAAGTPEPPILDATVLVEAFIRDHLERQVQVNLLSGLMAKMFTGTSNVFWSIKWKLTDGKSRFVCL
ncbi:hypothetical protein AAVH_25362 [Aphelenchoides avenae]|nr:hypothetical protein AAVH_25362 [Aphelenchus avenae]